MSRHERTGESTAAEGTSGWVISPLTAQIVRVRRRAWLVVLIALVAGAISYLQAAGQETVYTASSALTAASQSRAPEQDAFLAQGYADYFNQPAYQQLLTTRLDIPAGVTASARPAATSPIIYVEATATDPALAQSSVRRFAGAFRDDIRASLAAEADRATAELQSSLDDARKRLLDVTLAEYDRTLIGQEVLSLLDRIAEIRSNSTNQLKDLQVDAGISVEAPDPIQNAVLALVGGLILGILAAVGLGLVENRLFTPNDVRDRLALDTLAVVRSSRGTRGAAVRTRQLKGLSSVISLADMKRPITLAITTPRATSAKSEIAEALVHYRAVQGELALLLRTDMYAGDDRHEPGRPSLVEFLQDPDVSLEQLVIVRPSDDVIELPSGTTDRDPYTLFAPERFVELVHEAIKLADFVVIDVPPVLDAAEAQVACAAADYTVLVIESGGTKASDAAEACQLLDRVRANVLGVVINTPDRRPTRAKPVRSVPITEQDRRRYDEPTVRLNAGRPHPGPGARGPVRRMPDQDRMPAPGRQSRPIQELTAAPPPVPGPRSPVPAPVPPAPVPPAETAPTRASSGADRPREAPEPPADEPESREPATEAPPTEAAPDQGQPSTPARPAGFKPSPQVRTGEGRGQ